MTKAKPTTNSADLNTKVELDFRASQNLALEGLRNEIVRNIQNTRKQAALSISDKVHIVFRSQDQYIRAAATIYKDYIANEVLANSIKVEVGEGIKLNGHEYSYKPITHTTCYIEDGEIYFGKGHTSYWGALENEQP